MAGTILLLLAYFSVVWGTDEATFLETIISSIAAVLTTAAFVPQAYKIIHTRETKGVSLWMHLTFAIGVAFWFVLGFMLWNWPMMVANAVTFLLTVIIVIMKFRYR